ncbi:acyl carrier protein [Streptomyces sp. NPDC002596]|uniref:acyl carrier protein n=1 Tax=unclassified Streptomyces TaxID=2593676 RepID=UPI002253DD3F|nr:MULTISPECIES: phosphopantetheine-binding protein [unclassified Streptomyces]MCX4530636.1 phosphopantetheine-binding protein [Streptomyces sp. NBC_01669]WSA03612.1 phosphopantetheine-binding protein [Streptomyces sp. NBC_00841]
MTRDEMRSLVHEAITDILPSVAPERITDAAHLRDLGADSVDRVEIIISLQDRLGIDRPMAEFSDIPDIGALVGFLWKVRQQ